MAVTLTYTASSQTYTFSNPTVTFSSLSIGSAGSGRRIFVCYGYALSEGGDGTAASLTIGGVSATKHKQQKYTANGIDYYSEIWSANAADDVSTTATVVATHTGVADDPYPSIGVYRVTGHDTSTPVSSSNGAGATANSVSASITVPTGGVFIAGVYTLDTVAPAFSWSSATEDFDLSAFFDSFYTSISGASGNSSATPQASYTGNIFNDKSLAVVAVQQAPSGGLIIPRRTHGSRNPLLRM